MEMNDGVAATIEYMYNCIYRANLTNDNILRIKKNDFMEDSLEVCEIPHDP